ncbi:MAG: helix-turn-helix transcriptional regulator, partial [Verrucomicrobiales bacterium]
RPKKVGRPEKIYRLTTKVDPMFPHLDNELNMEILEATDRIYGPNAAEKLLYSYFQSKGDRFMPKVKGDTVEERTTSLARLRSQEGHLSECETDSGGGLRMVEYHSPLTHLAKTYPTVSRMEQQMIERLIGAKVNRTQESASGLVKYIFAVN